MLEEYQMRLAGLGRAGRSQRGELMNSTQRPNTFGRTLTAGFTLTVLAMIGNALISDFRLFVLYVPAGLVLGAAGFIAATDWRGLMTHSVQLDEQYRREAGLEPSRSMFRQPNALRAGGVLLVIIGLLFVVAGGAAVATWMAQP